MTTMDYIIGKVKGFHIANMTLAKWKLNYDRVRKEFWQTLGTIAVVILLLCLFGGDDATPVTTEHVDGTPTVTATAQPDDFIEQACRLYEERTGRKIYPTGRSYIRNGAIKDGLTTVESVLNLIHENEIFMWKCENVPLTKKEQQ